MSMQRQRSARELVGSAGRIPRIAGIAAYVLVCASALAQSHVNESPMGDRPSDDAPAEMSLAGVESQEEAEQPAAQPAGKPRDPMAAKDAKVTVSEHMTVDLHVKDEDLANVLELLSIQTQKNIIASKNVSGKVTATLYGVTFYQALDAILHVNGFGYIENGNFIYVYTTEELKQIEMAMKKRVSKVIRLNYLNADDAKEFVSPLLSKDGGEIKVNQKSKDFTINEKLPGGKDDYALTATLVVIDYEENIKAIEELVAQIDTRPVQVLVEATIMQTALTEANAFGVDFSVIGDLNFLDFVNVGGPLGAANALIRGGTGSSGQGLSPGTDRGNAVTSNPGNTAGPGTFKVGVLAGDVAIFLRMLDQVTDSVILSNPKILTLNRQPSRVLVGKRVGYLNTTSTETSTTQTVNFLDTGTQLYFRPFVSNEGEVRMELKPQVSAAEIRNVTDARGAVVTIPDEVTQEIVTNVNVRDGQTIVLGGLFTESSTFTRRQVPWIGDIPILGAAFRGHDDTTQRSEIIFLVTPTIINDSHLQAQAERAAGDIERLRTGQRQKLLPWSQDRQTDALNVEAEALARDGETDQALWNISRSLTLNPNQPEVYRLREKITGEKERWNERSLLNEIVDAELHKRSEQIQTPSTPPARQKPWGSRTPTYEPVSRQTNIEPGSKNTLVTPTNQDSQPIAGVGEPLSSTGFEQPLNNAAGSENAPATTTGASDNVYYAQMVPSDGTAFNENPGSPTQSANSMMTDGAPANTQTFTSTGEIANWANQNPAPTTPTPTPTPADANLLAATNADPNANAGNAEPSKAPSTPEEIDAALTKVTLANVRKQLAAYRTAKNGQWPSIGSDPDNVWKDLTESGLLAKVPTNPYVGGQFASGVLIADAPDIRFHTNYGWVYNPVTGQLWAAGFDANDKPLSRASAANVQPATTGELIQAISPENKPADSTASADEQKN